MSYRGTGESYGDHGGHREVCGVVWGQYRVMVGYIVVVHKCCHDVFG